MYQLQERWYISHVSSVQFLHRLQDNSSSSCSSNTKLTFFSNRSRSETASPPTPLLCLFSPFCFHMLSLSHYCHSFFKNLGRWLTSYVWERVRVLPVFKQKRSVSGRPCMINTAPIGSGSRCERSWSCEQGFAGPSPLSAIDQEWQKCCQKELDCNGSPTSLFLRFCRSSSLQWSVIKCPSFPLPQVLKVQKFSTLWVKYCLNEKLLKRLVRFRRATV